MVHICLMRSCPFASWFASLTGERRVADRLTQKIPISSRQFLRPETLPSPTAEHWRQILNSYNKLVPNTALCPIDEEKWRCRLCAGRKGMRKFRTCATSQPTVPRATILAEGIAVILERFPRGVYRLDLLMLSCVKLWLALRRKIGEVLSIARIASGSSKG